MLKTKSLSEPIDISDGKRILVSSYWPHRDSNQSIDIWFPELGSELELIKNWPRRKIDLNYFSEHYQKLIRQEPALSVIKKIAEESHYNTITLLCHCKKESQCHRKLLKEYIEETF